MNPFPSEKKLSFQSLLGIIQDSYKVGQETKTPKCCLFLGAGCSLSVIGGARHIIDLCKDISFFKNEKNMREKPFSEINLDEVKKFKEDNRESFEKYEREQSEIIANKLDADKKDYIGTIPDIYKQKSTKEELWEASKNDFLQDAQYGMWFEIFSKDPKERQSLLESLIDDKKPRGEYIFLAHLIKENVFKNIFTTNFDDLVNDALIHYLGIKPKVYAHNEIAKYIDFKSKKPNIVKLHGDYLFENIRNTIQETNSLADNMNEKLKGALAKDELDLIVIGYNGADYSVMKCLFEAKGMYDFNLYWCGRKEQNLHWRVKSLINTTKNSFFVPVDNFNQFIIETVIKVGIPYGYMKEAVNAETKIKISEIDKKEEEILNNLPKEIKKDIERRLFRLSDVHLEKVNSLPTLEEKKRYLSRFQLEAIGRIIKNTYDLYDRGKALALFEHLDDGKFFQDKIIHSQTPIQYIGNTFCNLRTVEPDRTAKIFKSLSDDVYIKKLETANEGEILSALNELSSIDSDKTLAIGKKVSPKLSKDLEQMSLLHFTKSFTGASRFAYIETLNKYPDEVYAQKIKDEGFLKFVTLVFDRIQSISPKKAQDILEIIPNENLIEKMKHEGCTLKQIGTALKCFGGISPIKARILLKEIPNKLLIEKMQSASFNDLSLALSDLKDVARDKIHKLFIDHYDDYYVDLIHKTTFTEMANGLAKLRALNYNKTWHILDKVDKNNLIGKLDSETFKFEGFGAALLNLIKIEEGKERKIFPDVIKKSHILTKAESFAKHAMVLKEQAFMTYFPFVIAMHEDLACEMMKYLKNSQVFLNLLQWADLDKYTSVLPRFLRVFEKAGMNKEAENFASFICFHQKNLKTKFSDAEIEMVKKEIRKYTTCS